MLIDSSNAPASPESSPAESSLAKRLGILGHVVVTSVTGILLYALPPILASVLLIMGISLSGVSEGRIESLFTDNSFGQFVYILTTEIIVLSLLLWLLKLAGESLRSIGIAAWPTLKTVGYVLGGLGVYYAAYIVAVLLISVLLPTIDLGQEQEIGFDRTGGDGLVWVFLSLVVLAPIAEELVFRGYLYARFRRVLSYAWAAIIVSLLFGAMHLQFGTGNPLLWVAAIDTFILSMVLVYQREKSGTIWASVVTHATKNFIAFYLIFIRAL